jgi:hypothetical protein
MWVFNPDPAIKPVRKEDDLSKFKTEIQKIVCYGQGTTGHLIANRVRNAMGMTGLPLVEVGFGQEFDDPVESTTCVVTADVLRLVHLDLTSKNRNNIIYNYATRSPQELVPFLFTGILTLQKTIDHSLWPAVAVLGAVRETMSRISERNVETKYIDVLIEIFSRPDYGDVFTKLGITSQLEKQKLIRESLGYLFHREEVYELELQPDKKEFWKLAWNNARGEWIRQHHRTYPEVQEKYDRIPSLLVRPSWRPDLRTYFEDDIKASQKSGATGPDISTKIVKKYRTDKERWVALVSEVALGFSGILLYVVVWSTFWGPVPWTSKHVTPFFLCLVAIMFLFECWEFWKLRGCIRRLDDSQNEYLAWAAAFVGYMGSVGGAALLS